MDNAELKTPSHALLLASEKEAHRASRRSRWKKGRVNYSLSS